ncbi:MAG: hypothetical protein AUI50_07145 [Crenarchaeota archaeon 13_1_40CM_2_52_14]|nr:MAG: hypothetical protein AUI97_07745 [Crenarchaeota archaeon 13_1_40CM_3_52_17]OLD34327.1 MAG: hypothetical protein AUI50_07145 [Crenarchaeota archaeon 13_1_40CM_2_52_14]
MVIGVQFALNIFLAGWLYDEYLHNRFMQDYLASTFSTASFVLPVGLVAFAAIVGGSFTAYSRRHHISTGHATPRLTTEMFVGSEEKPAILDTCPFCNAPLKSISENRFQCRKCRRYFKK